MRLGYGLTRTVRGVVFAAALGVVCVGALAFAETGLALNPERHYEMVSPVFKGGFGATDIAAVSPEGERVAFYAPNAFGEAPSGFNSADYVARRTSGGWVTTPLMAPASLLAQTQYVDFSPSLETELAIGYPGPSWEDIMAAGRFLLHPTGSPDTAANWESAASVEPLVEKLNTYYEKAASPDFCHVLFSSTYPLLPAASDAIDFELYEVNRGCGGEKASLKLVGVDNKGSEGEPVDKECEVNAGDETYAVNQQNTFNAVSVDGGEVFFTTCVYGIPAQGFPHQLFVRLGGVRTVEVSRPVGEVCVEVPCAGALLRGSAEFQGASEGGSRVFFTAPLSAGEVPLVPGDSDASNNLYVASVGCPTGSPGCAVSERAVVSMGEVSHDPNGGAAGVLGVLRVAPDGERAYFVATGDLLSAGQRQVLEGEGRPVPQAGADNLYVYSDTSGSGSIAFIGDLCSGHEASGSTEDIHCPSETGSDAQLWSSNDSESQTAGADGRFLVFSTYAQLTGDDANAARDVYRYDALTGALVRVSVGEGGYDANGNHGLLGSSIAAGNHGANSSGQLGHVTSQYEMGNRAIAEDGSRIVFVSAEPLSPKATNGLANVYEWHETPDGGGGTVSIVTSGSGTEPVEDVVISPDGSGVFFDTTEKLVSQDSDEVPDVYDARLGTGFAVPAVERRPCEGDGCQGPLTNPAPLLVPGSVAQAPRQDVPAPTSAGPPPPTRVAVKCRRGYRRDGRGGCVRSRKQQRKKGTRIRVVGKRASRGAKKGGRS
jgi:hypothetical protein